MPASAGEVKAEALGRLDTSVAHIARVYTHDVAQATAPGSRIVYVDNDHYKPGCAHERWAGQASGSRPRGQVRDRMRAALS